MIRPTWTSWLPVVIGVIALSFLAATGLGQWRMRAVDRAVLELATTTAPGIEHLASARGENRNLQALVREHVALAERGTRDREALDHSLHALARSIHDYLVLPVAAGEQELWRTLLAAKDRLERSVTKLESEVDRGAVDEARQRVLTEVEPAAADLEGALTRAIEFNAARSRSLAGAIERMRGATLVAAIALDTICTLIAAVGAVVVHRLAIRHERLAERHRAVQEARATELDRFAGRVAHDILGPLGTVAFALDLAARTEDAAERARFAKRGAAALERTKRLVAGLLDFARAAAAPAPDVHADVGDVLVDLAGELRPTAVAAGATLEIEQDRSQLVACSPGVLTSLIANLVRNALKYIGDGPDRRVVVRVLDRPGVVRVEVEDSGPGLPPDIADHVFDPYVRSAADVRPGIGLGLATVKRLAEGHRGAVGVTSVPGKGCTFWFELPRVETSDPARAELAAGRPAARARRP